MKIKIIAFLSILLIGFSAKANIYKITVGINDCSDVSNLCVGDTLRFSGDSLNATVYGVINGYVYNSTTLTYDYFSVTSFTSIETIYDHIIITGDDKFWLDLCSQEYNLYLNGCIVTGEKEISREKEINFYPNPNTGIFTIEYQSYQNQTLFISDLTGKIAHKEILSSKNIEHQIITNNLKNGLYLVAIKNENGETIYTEKISIIN